MSRVQLALNVSDLEKSIEFYSTVFGVEPHKLRPGYANFAIENPPLKLVLIEVPSDQRGSGPAGALNHLGVEVFSGEEVTQAAARFADAGLVTVDEQDTDCCFALQDKVWIHDPAGTPWEYYVIKDDNPESGGAIGTSILQMVDSDGAACCAPSDQGPACCTPVAIHSVPTA